MIILANNFNIWHLQFPHLTCIFHIYNSSPYLNCLKDSEPGIHFISILAISFKYCTCTVPNVNSLFVVCVGGGGGAGRVGVIV